MGGTLGDLHGLVPNRFALPRAAPDRSTMAQLARQTVAIVLAGGRGTRLGPLTEWLDGVVVRDARGFVLAGPDLASCGQRPPGWDLDRLPYHLETSVPGVFVAGDARAESAKRVASAVGEGAMAVMLVHRYLEKL